jgi:hypothetical protein
MAPFDGPALAAAKLELKKINKKDALGRKIVLKTCDTQSDDAAASKACADQLISQGAKIILTTCDVNLAGPVIQESAIKNHLLTVAPCIGTDQLGPKFPFCGGKNLCFSFGNLAHDHLLRCRRQRLQGAVQAARRQDQVRDDVPGSRHPSGLQ